MTYLITLLIVLCLGAAPAWAFEEPWPSTPLTTGPPAPFYQGYQSTPHVTDYFSPQGDHTTVYQITPGMSQAFTEDRDGHTSNTYIFAPRAPLPMTVPTAQTPVMQLYDEMQGRR